MKNSKLRILLHICIAFIFVLFISACQTKESFVVEFDGNGGYLVRGETRQEVTDNSKIKDPEFSKTGYIFDYWSIEEDEETGNVIKTAQWLPLINYDSYTVKNDGSLYLTVDYTVDSFDFKLYNNFFDKSSSYIEVFKENNTRVNSSSVDLHLGSNIFYLKVHDKTVREYKIEVYRYGIVNVKLNLQGGNFQYYTELSLQEGESLKSIIGSHTPTKEGYTFAGWRRQQGGKYYSYDITKPINYDIKLEAVWINENYTITFHPNNGESNVKKKNYYGLAYNFPYVTKVGHTLVGWFDINGIQYEKNEWKEAKNIDLYAKWEPNKYYVYLNTNGGTLNDNLKVEVTFVSDDEVIDTQQIGSSDTLKYVEPENKEGYIFAGWYKDNQLTQRFNFNETVNDDLVLFAKWYKISSSNYFVIDSTESEEEKSYNLTTNYTYLYLVVQNSDYNYIYYKNSSVSTSYYYEFSLYVYNETRSTSISSDSYIDNYSYDYIRFSANKGDIIRITLGASYAGYDVRASLYFEGFDVTSSSKGTNKLDVTYTQPFTLPIPERRGYTFDGWVNEQGTPLTDGNWYIDSNEKLYAKWDINEYKINYQLNGGTYDGELDYTYTIEDNVTFPKPHKDGYTFLGWKYIYFDTEKQETASKYVTSTNDFIGNITIYASYSADTYDVTLDTNQGTLEDFKITIQFNDSQSSAIYKTTEIGSNDILEYFEPEKSGSLFKGWYLDEDCTEYFDFSQRLYKDTTLYAGWEVFSNIRKSLIKVDPTQYNSSSSTKSYDMYNTSSSNIVYTYFNVNKTATYKIYYSSSHYSSSYGVYFKIYNLTSGVTIKSNSSYYSTSFSYISFNAKAGDVIYIAMYNYYGYSCYSYVYFEGFNELTETTTGVEHIQVSFDSAFELPEPTKDGYKFLGWYNNDDTLVSNGIWKLTNGLHLTAKWEVIAYNINYHLDGGTNHTDAEEKFTIHDTIVLKEPTREGYIFEGWYLNSSFNEKIESFSETNKDIDVYAKWTAIESNIYLDFNGGLNDEELDGITVTFISSDIIIKTVELHSGDILEYFEFDGSSYLFKGWYLDKDCTIYFDFSQNLYEDTTLYAGLEYFSNSYKSLNKVNPTQYNSSTSYISYTMQNTSGSDVLYAYFNVNKTSTYKIYYSSSYSSSTYSVYFKIYNLTSGVTIKSNSSYYSTSFSYVSFDAKAGDIIYIAMYNYYGYSCNARIYFEGFEEIVETTSGAEKIEVKFDADYTLPEPTKFKHKFLGWYDDNDNHVTSGIWKFTDNKKLTAKWELISYNITYHLDGGTNHEDAEEKIYIDDTVILKNPTKEGYTFEGWYEDAQFTNKIEIISDVYNNIEIFAKWKAIESNIYLDLNGGTTNQLLDGVTVKFISFDHTIKTVDLHSNDVLGYYTPTEIPGYLFNGWYLDKEYTELFDFKQRLYEDTSLYAKWIVFNKDNKALHQIDPSQHTNPSYSITYTTYETYISNPIVTYFNIIETKSYTIYYSVANSYIVYFEIYNVTQNQVIKSSSSYSSQYYTSQSFSANAGDVIYVSMYSNGSNSNARLYFEGFEPSSTIGTEKIAIKYDQSFNIPSLTKEGYLFVGWETEYNELFDVSGTCKLTNDIFLTAKWEKFDN